MRVSKQLAQADPPRLEPATFWIAIERCTVIAGFHGTDTDTDTDTDCSDAPIV